MHSPMGVHDVSMHHMINLTMRKTNFASSLDVVQLAQGAVTFVTNLVVLIVITSRKALRSKVPNLFFANLQVVHLLLSILIIVSEYFSTTWEEFAILVITGNALLMEMFISLMMSTIDRFIAIKYPFQHAEMTSKRVYKTLLVSWLPSVIFACLCLVIGVTQFQMTIICTVMITIASITLASSNVMVYVIAKKHQHFLEQNSGTQNSSGRSRVTKASYACFSIVFSFVVCWFPYVIHNILTLTHLYHPSSKKVFTLVAEQLGLLNSLIDPLLLLCFSEDTRKEMRHMVSIHHVSVPRSRSSTESSI